MVGRYVLVSVDTANRVIIDGPLLWDGVHEYVVPPGTQLLDEITALTNGYLYSAPTARMVNTNTLRSRALLSIATNSAFLTITSPTNAQAIAQVQALTRQMTVLIRLALDQTDSTDGS